jgi:hypothetical protein
MAAGHGGNINPLFVQYSLPDHFSQLHVNTVAVFSDLYFDDDMFLHFYHDPVIKSIIDICQVVTSGNIFQISFGNL